MDAKEILKDITVSEAEGSKVEIEGELPYAYLEKHRSEAVKAAGKDISIDGFRKGHIPEKVLIEHVGEMAILNEMAERALGEIYPLIIKEHELDVIGRPEISITKMAPENPLGFKAAVAVMPEITLPEYKEIAKEANAKKEEAVVSEGDVDTAIENVLRQKMAYERLQEKAEQKKAAEDAAADGKTLPTPETVGASDEEEDYSKLPLPELTDEYVKGLGPFENVDQFKGEMRKHLEAEKKQEVEGKNRAALTDAIIDATTIAVPQIMINAELSQITGQMEEDLRRAGMSIDAYLEHIKKTKEELIQEWTPAAEKRAKLQLILNRIAEEEKIKPDDDAVNKEVEHVLSHHKDADKDHVRIYVTSVLRNNKVMEMLESQ